MPSLGAAGSFTGTAENSPIASSAIIYTSRVSSSSRGDIRIYTIRVVTLRVFFAEAAKLRHPQGARGAGRAMYTRHAFCVFCCSKKTFTESPLPSVYTRRSVRACSRGKRVQPRGNENKEKQAVNKSHDSYTTRERGPSPDRPQF